MLLWLSDSLNLLNSVKVTLELGKTPLHCIVNICFDINFTSQTRMHSSRMCTNHSSSHLREGVSAWPHPPGRHPSTPYPHPLHHTPCPSIPHTLPLYATHPLHHTPSPSTPFPHHILPLHHTPTLYTTYPAPLRHTSSTPYALPLYTLSTPHTSSTPPTCEQEWQTPVNTLPCPLRGR